MKRFVPVFALVAVALVGCGDECPDGQSTCEDSSGKVQCFFDYPCEGAGLSYCPPTVCEEGASSECVNRSTSENHCGSCDIRCPMGMQCLNGRCQPPPAD